jgi:serine-type D-Ala-D-Ala carboxypeptidase (penicillin-binding protein 5/6)
MMTECPKKVFSGRKRMVGRKTAGVLAAAVCLILPWGAYAQEETAEVFTASAKAAVLIEQQTGTVLYAQNETSPLPMASTTKVMTALMTLEYGHLDEVVVTGRNAFGVPGSSIYLSLGEKLTLEQMLYGLMLASGNDAAVAIAEHISGSVDNFCKKMTERAAELGCKDTVFMTPHGLPNKIHHTTAFDLALIAREAMKYPLFRKIVSTQRATIPWEGRTYSRILNNKNKLLSTYEGATGIKTGYTRSAGRCLVFGAERDGLEVVGVVLNCPNWFDEAAKVMDYGFVNYRYVLMLKDGEQVRSLPVTSGEEKEVKVLLQGDLAAPVKQEEWPQMEFDLPDSLAAGVLKGQVVGTARLTLNGQTLVERPIIAANEVPLRTFRSGIGRILDQWLLAPESELAQ